MLWEKVYIINILLGVICHNTGDYSNVLKVKPPMCFSVDDANFFVDALETALQI